MFPFCTNIEWLETRPEYTVPVQEMEKQRLSECSNKFYLCIRKKDGSFVRVSSLKAIRAAVETFLKSVPNSKPLSIISDPQFNEANDASNALAKSIRGEGKVGSVVHKNPITKEHQIEMLFERQLGPTHAKCPPQLLRSSWLNITLYVRKRGREDQRQMRKTMPALRKTTLGKRYYEL